MRKLSMTSSCGERYFRLRLLLQPVKEKQADQQDSDRHKGKIESSLSSERLKNISCNNGSRRSAQRRKNHNQARHRPVLPRRQRAQNNRVDRRVNRRDKQAYERKYKRAQGRIAPSAHHL